ncbi:head-tail adaptor protein [Clostridium perfringens]|uniref:phage head closure protein n=1 Tax=Clostridium perfringens TaxID=1502 RepID=UPI000F8EF540|nr:phage head closure protein [Clostridium perfringens]RUR35142.1 head-tail adaptor protein [Clostridium perfringens]
MAECRLNERITIEELSITQNKNGFEEEKWNEYYKCWSSFNKVKGSKFIAAKADNSENIVTFTVRYCNKIKPLLGPEAIKKFKVCFKGNYYKLEYVDDFEQRHEWVDLKAKIIS